IDMLHRKDVFRERAVEFAIEGTDMQTRGHYRAASGEARRVRVQSELSGQDAECTVHTPGAEVERGDRGIPVQVPGTGEPLRPPGDARAEGSQEAAADIERIEIPVSAGQDGPGRLAPGSPVDPAVRIDLQGICGAQRTDARVVQVTHLQRGFEEADTAMAQNRRAGEVGGR